MFTNNNYQTIVKEIIQIHQINNLYIMLRFIVQIVDGMFM